MNSTTNRGYTSGSTLFAPGVTLTVSTTFIGSASPGPNNFRFDPVNTPGFAIQNLGTGDKNTTVDGSGRTILLNYQRVNFTFSSPVLINSLRISDIDTASSSGPTTQAWRDTVALGLWNGSPPSTPGSSGIFPAISLPGSPTRLAQALTSTGLPYAYANLLGNTATSNPAPANDPSTAQFSFTGSGGVDGFSLYLWNRGQGTGGQHAVVLQSSETDITVVPEPSALALLLIGVTSLCMRRRR